MKITDTYKNIKDGKYYVAPPYRRDEEKAVMELFISDLEHEFGTYGNPKAPLLFDKAWELGHAYGLSEVYWHYDDLSELIK